MKNENQGKKDKDSQLHIDTRVISTELPAQFREQSAPIYMSSGFYFNSYEQGSKLFKGEEKGFIYSRWENPNAWEMVQRLCALEHCEDGIATASGMAAAHAILESFLQSGDHILTSHALFGTTQNLVTKFLKRWNVGCTQVHIAATAAQWEQAMLPETRLILIESPSNPGMEVADIATIAKVAKKKGVLLVVDNCLATPAIQQPALLGADIIFHSTTKFIDGQGRTIGGVILGNEENIEILRSHIRMTGASLSPFNAWLISKSLETLILRMERHCSNAQKLAEYLEKHPAVKALRYPYLPSHPQYSIAKQQMSAGPPLLCLDLNGELEHVERLLNAPSFFRKMANFGDVHTIITHPASTTHSRITPEERERMNITDTTLRVSLGLESSDDILNEFTRLLKIAQR